MPNFLYSGGVSAVVAVDFYAPNNANITTSDFCIVSTDSNKTRFTRPTIDGQGFEFAAPGARVRFATNSANITVHLNYTNLIIRQDTYNGIGVVLSNGAQVGTFDRAIGAAGQITANVSFSSIALRNIEIVFPYCASVDFLGIDLDVGASLQAATARSAVRYVAIGDSITHGFSVSNIAQEWAYKLAVAKGWQMINHGYGGRQTEAADGTTLGNLAPTVATYLIGYNNFYPQTPLASFKAEFKAFINNFRAINTTAKLHCITPFWSPNSFGSLTLEMYRQQIRDALTELANTKNVLIEGEALATNSVTRFPDSVHPNDLGSSEIAANIAALVSV